MTSDVKPYYQDDYVTIYNGDCKDVLPHIGQVDAVITDPPYGLSATRNSGKTSKGGFMGKAWDYDVPSVDLWRLVLAACKPGAHLLAFAGTRTQHRMAVNIEDAGFEIRDMIAWVYGSGMPKSLDVSKQLDRMAGAEREVVGRMANPATPGKGTFNCSFDESKAVITAPATDAAKKWAGWGTSLKPSHEPLTWATKPLTTVPVCDMMQAETNIGGLICLSLSHAKHAESLLRSSPSGCAVGAGSALLIAAVHRGLSSGESSGVTAMFKSPETARTILNIVESWSGILAAVSERQSRFTTSTATRLTTALKTFNCLTSEIMRGAITPEGEQTLGRFMSAPIAGESSSGASAKPAGSTSVQGLASWLTESSIASIAEASFMPAVKAGSSVLLDAITSTAESISPAMEPITVARRPLDGTVAENVLVHGTGALNIDACRVETDDNTGRKPAECRDSKDKGTNFSACAKTGSVTDDWKKGRWPANLIHDGSDEVVGLFPVTTSGARTGGDAYKLGRYEGQRGARGLKVGGSCEASSGSAARFFKCCEKDSLPCLTCAKASDTIVSNHQERIELWKRIAVHNAGKNGRTSQATSEFIARTVAIGSQSESLVLNVKSAGNLCDLCATSIAVALVGIKTSAFSNEELQAILACTSNCNASTLIQNLASFAELWANTDTIPTTTSLSILFGSVRDAIARCTRPDTREAAGQKSAPARFVYIPKASKAERGAGNNHPTVKPIRLMQYLITLGLPPGGVLLDPFAGSGTTAVAAKSLGRKCVCIEKEEAYCRIAVNRLRQEYLPLNDAGMDK